ncbi:uncharacterized protein SOCE26_014760 [Sorangium cellulosum]|uniref:Uncharacterized protein n=1 Tax=Sorangium cellulosum TaxID=56 RepID=A0A2L0ELA6_SORCE|nr:hypothetical protein [Sorangium cellulosum]AUX40079.1 uncharacterized protein SOCE26_014760 [Sorangium cellulosum]
MPARRVRAPRAARRRAARRPRGRARGAAYRPRLTAIAPDRLEVPRVDIESVSRALLTVHALTQAPPLLALYRGAATQGEFQLEG